MWGDKAKPGPQVRPRLVFTCLCLAECAADVAECLGDLPPGELDGNQGDDGDQHYQECILDHARAPVIPECCPLLLGRDPQCQHWYSLLRGAARGNDSTEGGKSSMGRRTYSSYRRGAIPRRMASTAAWARSFTSSFAKIEAR